MVMKKTTVLIDEQLLTDAMEAIGARTKAEKEFQRLKIRLDALEIVETSTSLWERAYDLAYSLRRKGITVPYTNILIAASALMVSATVVHADSHFDLMQPHCGLKVESFVDATKRLKP
jgi:predicted nucleic acid-binding protein